MACCPMNELGKQWAVWLDQNGFTSNGKKDGKERNVVARVLGANRFNSVKHMQRSGPMHEWVGFDRLANVQNAIEFLKAHIQPKRKRSPSPSLEAVLSAPEVLSSF